MTGMKEGAGEDPFADEDEREASSTTADPDPTERQPETGTDSETTPTHHHGQQQAVQIPYKLRRDGVHDGRDRVPLFLMPDTKRAERDARRELEERFDDDISLTDLREALMKTGLQHLDNVEHHLEEWGYGMTFDE